MALWLAQISGLGEGRAVRDYLVRPSLSCLLCTAGSQKIPFSGTHPTKEQAGILCTILIGRLRE